MAVSKACAVVGLSRAAFYKTGESAVQRDVEVIDALKEDLQNAGPDLLARIVAGGDHLSHATD